jgi:hypothetical protein
MKPPNRFHVIIIIVFGVMVGIGVLGNLNTLLVPHWKTYTAPDGSFSVQFPGEPSVEAQQAPREGGGTVTVNIFLVELWRGPTYICTYVEDDAIRNGAPGERLNAFRDAALRKIRGTVISQKRMDVLGYPVLEMQARAEPSAVMDTRIIIAGNRLYMLGVMGTDGEYRRKSEYVQRMFESFRILKH